MLKQILAGTAAVAAMALATGAMAADDTFDVLVNIEVLDNVSMWPDHANIELELAGGPENADAFQSGINYITNAATKIEVAVAGTLPGEEINFFIFDNTDEATASAAIVGNANQPVGALRWRQADLGATQHELVNPLAIAPNIVNRPVTYAASAPNILPAVANFDLTVTYTMTSIP